MTTETKYLIKENELRIGNWLKWVGVNPEYDQVCIFETYHINENAIELFEPIHLTPEILEKCGFEKSLSADVEERTIYGIQVANNTSLYFDPHKDWMRNDYDVEWYLSHEWNNNHFKNDFWAKPKYLHQLQNLYFALTGEELEVNL